MSRPAPEVVTPDLLKEWPLPRLGADKESRGRVLVVGGSRDTPGAVRLAAEAALRVGAGKVQVVTARSAATALAVAMPETMVRGVAEGVDGELLTSHVVPVVTELAPACEAVLLGPGLGDPESARDTVTQILSALSVPVVLDALALAAVTADPGCVSRLRGRAVLTPNIRELAHTLRWEPDKVEADPRAATLRLAARADVCVSGGGAVTWTAQPDGRSWRGSVGGPGLGTAGSGDVKAGVIVGLMARGADPCQAAVWGSHLHGSAGDRLTALHGAGGFLARELTGQLPQVLSELEA